MHTMLLPYVKDIELKGELRDKIQVFLQKNDCTSTAVHCLQVGAEAQRLALRCEVDAGQAEQAGWLHDISAVIPHAQRLAAAEALSLEVLPEEAAYPMILHQKLSVVIARQIFALENEAVLSAIGCHTTLKANASRLDQVVFIADKLAWDGAGTAPFYTAIAQGLERSLEHGVFAYLDYLWQRRETLRAVHPWLAAAHQQMAAYLS